MTPLLFALPALLDLVPKLGALFSSGSAMSTRNLEAAQVVVDVAKQAIGARNEQQLKDNLGSIGWNLTPDQVKKLDAASTLPAAYPYWHQAGFAERNPPPV